MPSLSLASSQNGEGLYSVNEGPAADINNGGAPYLATNTYAMGIGPVLESRGEPYEYHLQVIKVPNGYSYDTKKEFYAEANGGEMTIVVTKD